MDVVSLSAYHLGEFSDGDAKDLCELFGWEERTQTSVDVWHEVCGEHNAESTKVLSFLAVESRLFRSATTYRPKMIKTLHVTREAAAEIQTVDIGADQCMLFNSSDHFTTLLTTIFCSKN